ncbi:MAG: DUF5615 family PIN-like protein [Phycisphaerae bacterium]
MKPLLDECLSPQLQRRHPRNCGLRGLGDSAVWNHAKDEGYFTLTKDKDFVVLAERNGPPPQVVRLALPNASSREVEACVRENMIAIRALLAEPCRPLLLIPERA